MFSKGFKKQATASLSYAAKQLGFVAGPAKKITSGIRPSVLKPPTAPVTDITRKAIKTTNEMSSYGKAATSHVNERNYASIPDYAPQTATAPKPTTSKGFMAKLFR